MEYNESEELAQMADLFEIEIGRREKRPMCQKCFRPAPVCWCRNLQGDKVNIKSRVILLQHPSEEKRTLRTAPILEALLPEGNFEKIKSKRFSLTRFPNLKEIIQNQNSILLYPGKNACDINTLKPVGVDQPPYNILIIDGTWQQAKAIYNMNSYLKEMKQVRLTTNFPSYYIIRTQPTEDALSTVETAAVALSILENNRNIHLQLVNPLKLICQFQMEHGAVEHQSKEALIISGQYQKLLGKRTSKKLKRSSDINNHLTLKEILSARGRYENNKSKLFPKNKDNCDGINSAIQDIAKCTLKEEDELDLRNFNSDDR